MIYLGLKSGRIYKMIQRDRNNIKSKKYRENKKSEKGGEGYWENKIDTMMGKSSNYKTCVYYHIIYLY